MTKPTGLAEFLTKRMVTLPEKTVHVPEWDRDVTLRGLSAFERDEWEAENLRRGQAKRANGQRRVDPTAEVTTDFTNWRGRFVARHIVENGRRITLNPLIEELLGNEAAAVIDPLFAVCQGLSGVTQADVEVLIKNFGLMNDGEPSSVSPPSSAAPSKNSESESAIAN